MVSVGAAVTKAKMKGLLMSGCFPVKLSYDWSLLLITLFPLWDFLQQQLEISKHEEELKLLEKKM